jgi:hypothetical protein
MLPDALPQRIEADDEDWSLPLSVEEDTTGAPPEVEAVPVLSAASSTSPFDCDVEAPFGAGNATPRRDSNRETLSRPRKGWARQGLLTGTLFLGSFALGLHLFAANSKVPPVARQEFSEANKNKEVPKDLASIQHTPAAKADKVPTSKVAAGDSTGAKAPVRPKDAKPTPAASLYDRVRRVVLENKTEETERLGMGDIAYQHVPEDGSIMVGMEVTYAPFFTHYVIKSVRPIYQGPGGERYDGPVCGIPTGVRARVVAKEGFAIGGAAIKAGMGIDAMQLTFMEIGADGLNPNKTYLSKWLGGYGGADAKMFVNDGRPILGVAGMRSRNSFGPAFCLCFITTKAGELAETRRQINLHPLREAAR